jgi:hypothetical protein
MNKLIITAKRLKVKIAGGKLLVRKATQMAAYNIAAR